MPTHPIKPLLEWLPGYDFTILSHGFLPHGRDYALLIEDYIGHDPGRHELIFTHCVALDYETRVAEDIWFRSWLDDFTDYARWKAAGEPDGFVWGTNWSVAYPGLSIIEDSPLAEKWSKRVGHPFFEVTLETDRFFLRIVFHDLRHSKISDGTSTISKTIFPLP
jgi:hypothetical protein